MVSKDYEDRLRALVRSYFKEVKQVRFYPNSVTVTLKEEFVTTDYLFDEAWDMIRDFDLYPALEIEVVRNDRFKIHVARELKPISPRTKQSKEIKSVPIVNEDTLFSALDSYLSDFADDEPTFDFNSQKHEDAVNAIIDDVYAEIEEENRPIESKEEIAQIIADSKKTAPPLSLETRLLDIQIEALEEEIKSFLSVNFQHVWDIQSRTYTDTEGIKAIMKFAYIAGKFSSVQMKDMQALMEVWAKHFPDSDADLQLG